MIHVSFLSPKSVVSPCLYLPWSQCQARVLPVLFHFLTVSHPVFVVFSVASPLLLCLISSFSVSQPSPLPWSTLGIYSVSFPLYLVDSSVYLLSCFMFQVSGFQVSCFRSSHSMYLVFSCFHSLGFVSLVFVFPMLFFVFHTAINKDSLLVKVAFLLQCLHLDPLSPLHMVYQHRPDKVFSF